MFRPNYNPTENTLVECNPLVIIPALAVQIGLNNAIFLQQLFYWLRTNEQQEAHKTEQKHFRDGCWWCYNTYEDWRSQNFPFWNERTIKRIVDDLRERGFIITTCKYNKRARDRTLWYTIDYDALTASHRLLENATPDRAVPQLRYREETAEDWFAHHSGQAATAPEVELPDISSLVDESGQNSEFPNIDDSGLDWLLDSASCSSSADASALVSGTNGGSPSPAEE